MKARTGRPPKMPDPGAPYSTLTIRLTAAEKAQLVTMAEGYGMTLTEYITTLVARDATSATPAD